LSWISGLYGERRRPRREGPPAIVEVLETRALLADGITPAAGAPISAVAGVPISNAVFASFTVSDPSALLGPANLERAKIIFGDGQVDKNVPATPAGNGFEFVDSHTYAAPGNYTVTIMIASPGSHKPMDNVVTTNATVTPSSAPPPSSLVATGEHRKAKVDKPFHQEMARFREPHSTPGNFTVLIDWGDNSGLTAGQVRRQGKGRYKVIGSHQYSTSGVFPVMVMITDASGQMVSAISSVKVK
jgi:hypothetical protein